MFVLRWIGGLLAANLPRRYWPALDDHVPASAMATAAGLATMMVGLVAGVFGYGLMFFQFLLLTPQGWFALYATVTGLARAVGPLFDDPHGGFLLTLVDTGARKAWARTAARGAINNRMLLEGPEVRDRVRSGAQLGLSTADLVVVASRVKEGWELGAVVVTDRGPYRVIDMEDRTIDGRLRRLYSLVGHQDLEVFRKIVHYDFPEG